MTARLLRVSLSLLICFSGPTGYTADDECNTLLTSPRPRPKLTLLSVHGGKLIANDDPTAYANLILKENPNQNILTEGTRPKLDGFSTRLEGRIQETSVVNDSARVTSYFKYFEGAEKKTYEVAATLWKRTAFERPNLFWHEAIAQANSYVDYYNRLGEDYFQIAAKGFEAFELSFILRDLMSKYSSRDFTQEPIRTQGVAFEKPFYRYNPQENTIEKTYLPSTINRYDTLVLDHKAAVKTYQKIFSIKSNPIQILRDGRYKKASYDWGQLKDPSYIILSPFYLIFSVFKGVKGGINYAAESLDWVSSSVFHTEGTFHRRMVQQAFEKRRLEIIRDVIISRNESLRDELQPEETKLLERIRASLANPDHVPTPKALNYVQKQEYDAERSVMLGQVSNRNTSVEKLGLNIYSRPSTLIRVRPIRSQYFDRAKEKIKKWAPTVIVTTVLVGTVSTQYNNIKDQLLDTPEVAYHLTQANDVIYDLRKKFFGMESLVYNQVKNSDRTWSLENVEIPTAVKSGTQIFYDEYRLNPEANFLADQEYNRELREIIEITLAEREQRGSAVAYQYAMDQTKLWGYPTRTVKLLFQNLTAVYPQETPVLAQVRDRILKDIDNRLILADQKESQLGFLKNLQPSITPKLYRDLHYMLNVRLLPAVEYYGLNGALLNPNGSVYDYFIRAPDSYTEHLHD